MVNCDWVLPKNGSVVLMAYGVKPEVGEQTSFIGEMNYYISRQ